METSVHLGDTLSAYADEELGEAERAKAEAHLAGCADCREELAVLRSVRRSLQSAYRTLPTPTGLERKVLAALQAEAVPHASRRYNRMWVPAVLSLTALLVAIRYAVIPIKLTSLLSRVLLAVAHAVMSALASEPTWAWGLAVTAVLLIGLSGMLLRVLLNGGGGMGDANTAVEASK